MTFRTLEIAGAGPTVTGTTRLGREARITVRVSDGRRRFDVAVSAMQGFEENDPDGSAAEIELRRVMDESDAISDKLRSLFGEDPSGVPVAELIRGAASVLDRRDVEPELIEALIGLAGGVEPDAPAPGL